jgi:hypothetical protein
VIAANGQSSHAELGRHPPNGGSEFAADYGEMARSNNPDSHVVLAGFFANEVNKTSPAAAVFAAEPAKLLTIR